MPAFWVLSVSVSASSVCPVYSSCCGVLSGLVYLAHHVSSSSPPVSYLPLHLSCLLYLTLHLLLLLSLCPSVSYTFSFYLISISQSVSSVVSLSTCLVSPHLLSHISLTISLVCCLPLYLSRIPLPSRLLSLHLSIFAMSRARHFRQDQWIQLSASPTPGWSDWSKTVISVCLETNFVTFWTC